MTSPYERLGIAPTATPNEIKAAYHAKLREFPAHTYPEEFKAIRSAYEAIRKGGATQAEEFFQVRPLDGNPDPEWVEQLRSRLVGKLEISLEEMIRATF